MEKAEVFEALRTELDAAQIPWRELREGIVLEFADGCDMLLVDDRAIAHYAQETPQRTAQVIFKRFDKLNRRRKAVLIGLRHWAVRSNVAIQRSPTGHWHLEKKQRTSSIDVGHVLTRLVEDRAPHDALLELLQWCGLFDRISPADARQVVTFQSPPENECSVSEEPEDEWAPLRWHNASLKISNKTTEENLVWRLRQRLPNYQVDAEYCTPKRSIAIQFADGESYFALHSSRSYLKSQVARHGSFNALVDHLVARFKRFDTGRGQVLHALENILADRGCFKGRFNVHHGDWAYGKTHQQYRFSPGVSLTRALNRHTPIDVALSWCESQQVTPTVTREEIIDALARPAVEVPTRILPSVPFEEGPQIPSIDAWDFVQLDDLARTTIEAFRKEAAKPEKKQTRFSRSALCYWNHPDWYVRDQDTWVDDAWWIDQARLAWQRGENEGKPYIVAPQAAYMLLAYGIDLPRKRVLDCYRDTEYHPEAILDELAWVLEGELPWSMLEFNEENSYPPQLGKLPPRVARNIAMMARDAMRSIDSGSSDYDLDSLLRDCTRLDRESAEEWLLPREIEWLHTACMKWASATEDLEQMWDISPLQIAIHFEWPEVAERLAESPCAATSLLGSNDMYLDPSGFVLALSRLQPNHFAARWAAFILARDFQTELENNVAKITKWVFRGADEDLLKGKDRFIQQTTKSQTQAQNAQKLAAAIAWHRCREAGLIG
ncbi:hypothetical protein [Blastopirellula marina]|uniref:Uncharacterized protein n=1 Tax=Blastopirellula marina TaxID=124 RepID=A0A2S8GTW5_9BACT|nr:hypothetical protein [Blastopirellula marina]PQO47821.1 hypothetical protein C5Y93_01905 [Blastopirellula marina]